MRRIQSSLATQESLIKAEYPNAVIISDVASAFNFRRKGLQHILERAMRADVIHVVATSQDRLARSVCKLIRHLVELSGGHVTSLDGETNTKVGFDTNTLAVERYKEGTHLDETGKFINLRPWVKGLLKPQQAAAGRVYNSLICDNAVREAESKFKHILNKNKGKKAQDGLSKIGFKSRKGDFHTFRMCRLPSCLYPAKTSLGNITLTESVPKEAIDKSFSVSFDKGRWFISVLQLIRLQPENQGQVKCVAIDPGSRTFATCYSPSEVVIAGDSFAQKTLFTLMRKVDDLLGQRQRILNQNKGVKFMYMPQWARDRLMFIDTKTRQLKSKKDDLVRDMHHRLADYLTRGYDVVFLPHFQTQKMVKRQKGRVIRRNTCRQMLNLCHYQFKLVLKWYASKRGKRVIDSNESYTSKTLSHSGKVLENLGGKKHIEDGDIIIDRDVNGARGIFIKTLLQVT